MGSYVQQPFAGCRASANGTDPLRSSPLHVKRLQSFSQSLAGIPIKSLLVRSSNILRLPIIDTRTKAGLPASAPLPPNPPQGSSSVAAIILGGGVGTRLFPLTKNRAKPAVPIGGAYRLIDVPMSNCINSNINKIYILTQFNSTSLNRHLARTYNLGSGVRSGGDGFVEVLAASQTPDDKNWFQGTADAVRQYLWLLDDIKNRVVQDIVILSGDHLYRMDYMKFVNHHRLTQADITIACLPVDEEKAKGFGLMKIDDQGRIREFAEKPKGEALHAMRVDTTKLGLDDEEAAEKPYIASMGIYVFKKDILLKLLRNTGDYDFGGQVIPGAAKDHKVQAYLFNDYWEDIGTIKTFFEANLALAEMPPKFEFYDPLTPIYTSPRFLPPAKLMDCKLSDCIISHGAFLENCTVDHAIVGLRSRVGSGTKITSAMVIGADYFEDEDTRKSLLAQGMVPIGIGHNTIIENAIIDKNARIGDDCVLVNKEGIDEADHPEKGYYIRSGIICIERNAKIPNGTHI